MVQNGRCIFIFLNLKKCIHVENFQELQNITEYVHNDVLFMTKSKVK